MMPVMRPFTLGRCSINASVDGLVIDALLAVLLDDV